MNLPINIPSGGPGIIVDPFVGIVACTNDACYFRCNAGDFDRISAAMGYTKCVAEQHHVYIDDEHAKWLWEEGKKAWARVKEVFA